jgi:hypothetical protein
MGIFGVSRNIEGKFIMKVYFRNLLERVSSDEMEIEMNSFIVSSSDNS